MRLIDWGSDVCSSDLEHVVAEDAGAGAGAADVHAARVALADQLGCRGAADDGGDAQLVAAGEENAGGGLELAQVLVALAVRSEEHTSELQSLMRISYAVFCLKKKTNTDTA